jgi:hypothetical protein
MLPPSGGQVTKYRNSLRGWYAADNDNDDPACHDAGADCDRRTDHAFHGAMNEALLRTLPAVVRLSPWDRAGTAIVLPCNSPLGTGSVATKSGCNYREHVRGRGRVSENEMPIEIGQIEAIFHYPVKSMRGEPVDVATLGWYGLDGDRRLAFRRLDERGGFPWLTASISQRKAGERIGTSPLRTPWRT